MENRQTKLEAAYKSIRDQAKLLTTLHEEINYLTQTDDLNETEKITRNKELDRRLRDASGLLHTMRDQLYTAKQAVRW